MWGWDRRRQPAPRTGATLRRAPNPRSAAGTVSPGQAMVARTAGSGTSAGKVKAAMHDPGAGGGDKGSHEAPGSPCGRPDPSFADHQRKTARAQRGRTGLQGDRIHRGSANAEAGSSGAGRGTEPLPRIARHGRVALKGTKPYERRPLWCRRSGVVGPAPIGRRTRGPARPERTMSRDVNDASPANDAEVPRRTDRWMPPTGRAD